MTECASRGVPPMAEEYFWDSNSELRAEAEAERERFRKTKPDGAAAEPRPPLTLIDPATLSEVPVPPRRWLVPDWVPLSRATALFVEADPAVGLPLGRDAAIAEAARLLGCGVFG